MRAGSGIEALAGFWVFNNRDGTCSGLFSMANEASRAIATLAEHEEVLKVRSRLTCRS